MFIFPVQLTTSRIGNLTLLIHTLLYVVTIHTYIHILTFQALSFYNKAIWSSNDSSVRPPLLGTKISDIARQGNS